MAAGATVAPPAVPRRRPGGAAPAVRRSRGQRPLRPRHGGAAHAVLAAALAGVIALAVGARPAAARVEIITENPSPFVAVDPDAPKFVVNLFESADKAPPAPSGAAPAGWELMTAAGGQRYNCSLPAAPRRGSASSGGGGGDGSGGAGGGSAQATQLAKPQDAPPQQQPGRTPFELLDPLTAICLYHKDATWTYEVCHRNRVRQFRQEGSGRTEEFSCGAFTGDDKQTEALAEDTSASGRPVKYVVHRFGSGAKCLLTGQPRTAEVRYTCLRGVKDNQVVSVREFPTCNYVVLVATPLLCGHPAFAPPPEDLRLINCVPLQSPEAGGGGEQGGGMISGAASAAAGGSRGMAAAAGGPGAAAGGGSGAGAAGEAAAGGSGAGGGAAAEDKPGAGGSGGRVEL